MHSANFTAFSCLVSFLARRCWRVVPLPVVAVSDGASRTAARADQGDQARAASGRGSSTHGCILGSCVGSAYMGGQPLVDGFGAQLVVPGLVAVDLAQPVLGAVLGQPRRGPGGPDVDRVPRHVRGRVGVATQRAASSSEPYFETASRSSRSWYAGERQPLLTWNSTPSSAASVAAWRRAPRRAGSSLATPGTSSSKTVVPSGTAPSASPSAPRCSPRRHVDGRMRRRGRGRGPSRTRTPATGSRGLRRSPR